MTCGDNDQKSKENLYLLVMKGQVCIDCFDVDYAIGYKNVKKSACEIALILSACRNIHHHLTIYKITDILYKCKHPCKFSNKYNN